jgi:tetratricopeptide (TPR) repeat protein
MTEKPKILSIPTHIALAVENDATVARYPHHADLYHLQALEEIARGAIDDALISYHKATNLTDKYHPLIHFQGSHLFLDKAVTLVHLGRHDEAEKDYAHAVFLDHRNALALRRARTPTRTGLSDYHPSTPRLQDYHGRVKLSTHGYLFDPIPHDAGEALPFSDLMLAHDAAYDAQTAGNIAEAREIYDTILREDMTCRHSWHHLGQCHIREGNLDEAMRCLGRSAVLERDVHAHYHRDAARHYTNRAILYCIKEQWDMALNDCNKALNLNTGDVHAGAVKAYVTDQKVTGQKLPIFMGA